MQDPLQIGNYSDLDLQEFKAERLLKLLVAICDRAQEEVRMVPIWEAKRIERYRARQEQHDRNLEDYNSAREAFVRNSWEVDKWVRSQSQGGRGRQGGRVDE